MKFKIVPKNGVYDRILHEKHSLNRIGALSQCTLIWRPYMQQSHHQHGGDDHFNPCFSLPPFVNLKLIAVIFGVDMFMRGTQDSYNLAIKRSKSIRLHRRCVSRQHFTIVSPKTIAPPQSRLNIQDDIPGHCFKLFSSMLGNR
jgi:hypothetical protein